jgi:hypothetical protein
MVWLTEEPAIIQGGSSQPQFLSLLFVQRSERFNHAVGLFDAHFACFY